MAITRNSSSTESTAKPISRKRKASNDIDKNLVVKQRRTKAPAVLLDYWFLQDAIKQFAELSLPKNCRRGEDVELLRQFLPCFQVAGDDDATIFDDIRMARRWMIEKAVMSAPIFVKGSCNYSTIDPESKQRPMDQMLDLFPRSDEQLEFDNASKPRDSPKSQTTIGKLRRRLQANNGFVKYPQNFPDIPNPTMDHGIPSFVQNSSCTMLTNICREQLNVSNGEICSCRNGKRIPECGHYTTQAEFIDLGQSWRYWQGAAMIAEAGAVSAPHFDRYALGTWISCFEGEIGFGWLANPTAEQQVAWYEDPDNTDGKWLFTVLRPGNTVYMPPGTVHFVFRIPHGKQTLGFAGHLLRQRELVRWLETLATELRLGGDDESQEGTYASTIIGLMRGVRETVKQARKEGREERFGGEARLKEASTLVGVIEKLLKKRKNEART